jgi:mxaA protein
MSKTMQPSYFIRGYLLHALIILCSMCYSTHIFADSKLPFIDEKYIDVKVEDPTRDAGYVVGDILNRSVTITIKKPYQLVTESLPIVGYEHRYKGQVSGIELAKIDVNSKESADSETHILNLSYQVFKTGRVAKPAALRAESLRFRNLENKKQVVQYKLPAFTFRISPLSVIGQVKLDQEMYPFIPPLTIDNSNVIFNLKTLAVLLSLALLGLLYIFGTHAWLPRMGAPFAKAYRDIKKMPDSTEGIQQAVARVHESLNKTAGASLFSNNLDVFIAKNPAFSPTKKEIEQFFGLSHQVFFGDASQALTTENPKTWLLQLCRKLRDCERGLTPDLPQGANA